eukprot:scaffold103923_cov19-Tisochrysis_lutea.AAC.4
MLMHCPEAFKLLSPQIVRPAGWSLRVVQHVEIRNHCIVACVFRGCMVFLCYQKSVDGDERGLNPPTDGIGASETLAGLLLQEPFLNA